MIRIDVPALLSETNSKLYRQGRSYRLRLKLVTPHTNQGVQYKIFTLPNTWFTHGAVKHAFRNYKAAMQDELMQTGGKHAKWHDFRIAVSDPDGTDSGTGGVTFTGANWLHNPTVGDLVNSSVTNSAGTSIGFHLVGDVSNSYNIMEHYARYLEQRRTPPTDFSGPQSYEGMFKGADDLDNLMEEGDQPPYSIDMKGWWDSNEDGTLNDASTALSYEGTMYSATGLDAAQTHSQWFDAPLGMVYIYTSAADFWYTDAEGGPEIAFEAAAGSYKGVKSSPIFRHDLAGSTAKSMR